MKHTLGFTLQEANVALYEFDEYTVAVGDRSFEGEQGYNLTVAKEDFPPHVNEDFDTLEEVENYLNGTLGYIKGARAWIAREEE